MAISRQPSRDGLVDFVQLTVEMIGGAGGAHYLGGTLPDLLEPAHHPRHRQLAHSYCTAALITNAATALLRWQDHWRAKGNRLMSASDNEVRLLDRITLIVRAIVCWMMAGATIGVPFGYLTHLVQDSQTRAGLPLLGL